MIKNSKLLHVQILLLAIAGLYSILLPAAQAQSAPPPHYENWGVCPFECCTYREWTATSDIPVYRERKAGSALAFRLHSDEKVTAVTGVVITEQAVKVRIARTVQEGYLDGQQEPQLTLKPGEIVYLLAPLGEGAYMFWYQGKVYRSGVEMATQPALNAELARFVWWKKIRNSAGKSGWTRSNNFSNSDACG